ASTQAAGMLQKIKRRVELRHTAGRLGQSVPQMVRTVADPHPRARDGMRLFDSPRRRRQHAAQGNDCFPSVHGAPSQLALRSQYLSEKQIGSPSVLEEPVVSLKKFDPRLRSLGDGRLPLRVPCALEALVG